MITCATEGHLFGAFGKCVMCGHFAPSPDVRLVSGVGRDSGAENVLVVYCSRRPTDDEMRVIHDAIREACK